MGKAFSSPMGILRFSSKNKALVVVSGTAHYSTFSTNCNKFKIVQPGTPDEAECTPPEIEN